MRGSQTEFEQQERLFAMLEQKNGEIKHLLGEINKLEKFKVYVTSFQKPNSELNFSIFFSFHSLLCNKLSVSVQIDPMFKFS